MINASEAREDDEDFQNPVDLMFERLEEKNPEHFAVKQYKKYKLAAGVVCSERLLMVSVYPLWKADNYPGQSRRGQDLLCHAPCGGLHQSKAFARYGDT